MDFTLFLDKNKKPSSRRLNDMSPEQRAALKAASAWLPETAPPAERLYVAIHGLTAYPRLCNRPGCENGPLFGSWTRAYQSHYCSQPCAWADKKNKPKKARKPLLSKEERVARQEQANIEKYGVRWPWMREDVKQVKKDKGLARLAEEWRAELSEHGYEPQFEVEDYKGNRQWCSVKHVACGTEFKVQRLRWVSSDHHCPTCWSPRASSGQHDLAEWVRSLGVKVRVNDRKEFAGKLELDLYIPERNLAIEYDGLYWHSERGRPDIKEKSWEKFQALRSRGIKFMMVFDDEWEKKNDIVKSRIRNALGVVENRIMARKCDLVKLDSKTAKVFMDENHTQGGIASEVAIGLQHDGELVAVMTFGRSRFNARYEWELLRFATKAGTSVIGGASKIFNAWKKEYPGSIVSFSDNRWGTGSFYEKLGFKNDGQTGQGYFYTNSNAIRRSRQQHMKHKLEYHFGEKFDPALTERENCWNNGWYRVWDLGNTRWILERNENDSAK